MLFKLEEVGFSYQDKEILKDLSFVIEETDRFISLIGPNGSGKTTLMNLMTGFFKNHTGRVEYRGKPIDEYKISDLAKEITVVSQGASINFPFTCSEVVMMGRTPFKKKMKGASDEDYEIVYEAMEETDTLKFADKLITQLSGGEKQRVLLARALAQTPRVLFLDEAFSAMDISYSIKLLGLLKNIVESRKITVISIMHDLNMVDVFSDKILAMGRGRLANWGSRQEVMTEDFINDLFKINIERVKERGILVVPEKIVC